MPSSDIALYDHPGSTNSYKAHLVLSMVGVAYERVTLPFSTAGERPQWFLDVNPRGLVPALRAGDEWIWDSTAILVYVARRYGGERWFPSDALHAARVAQWLALAQSEILHGLVRARHIMRGSRSGDADEARKLGRTALLTLEHRLANHDYLAAHAATIADIACYPHVARAEESAISLEDYPAIRRWLARVESIPGWAARRAESGRPWN